MSADLYPAARAAQVCRVTVYDLAESIGDEDKARQITQAVTQLEAAVWNHAIATVGARQAHQIAELLK